MTRTHCPTCHKRYSEVSLLDPKYHQCKLTLEVGKVVFLYQEGYQIPRLLRLENYIDCLVLDLTQATLELRVAQAIRFVRKWLTEWDRRYMTMPTEKFIRPWAILLLSPDSLDCAQLKPYPEQVFDPESLFTSCKFIDNYTKIDYEQEGGDRDAES